MTREEAISGLKEIREWKGLPYCIEEPLGKEGVAVISTEMIDMAIKALEQEPCETQMIDKSNFSQEQYKADLQSAYDCGKASVKPCGDCISRQAVLELVADYDLSMGQVVGGIHALPPVNPQPKTGHWIRWYEQKENDWMIDNIPHCKCSECGKEYDPHSSQFIKYCNECGAKMVEPQESEG